MFASNRFRRFLIPLSCLLVIVGVANAQYSGGSGTLDDPYQIATATDLIALGETPEDYDKHFILTADIDLDPNLPGGRIFNRAVIAPDLDANDGDFQGTAFSGTFEGDTYKVLNFRVDAGNGEYLGLFGNVTLTGAIHEVVLESAVIAGCRYVGGLVGCNRGLVSDCEVTCYLRGQGFWPWKIGGLAASNSGSIERCRVTGEIHATESSIYVGGLAGWNAGTLVDCRAGVDILGGASCWNMAGLVGDNRGPITDCHATGNITAGDRLRFAGGLVGTSQTVTIARCSATGHISAGAESDRLAGLIGGNPSSAITCSYATGDVTAGDGSWSLGGLAGDNLGTIANCWASGSVSNGDGGRSIAGLVGTNVGPVIDSYSTGAVSVGEDTQYSGALIGRGSGSVEGCFWDMDTSGQSTSAGGQGRTTAEMQTADTFLEAGWDFVGETDNGPNDIWTISEGLGYPRLRWQKYGGGSGTDDDPYRIGTTVDLIALGETPEDYDKHFILTADIDLDPNLPGGKVFDRAVIAPDMDPNDPGFQGTAFTGVLDGNGHAISHLTIVGQDYLGLIGEVKYDDPADPKARIENIGVEDVSVTGSGEIIGGLVGHNDSVIVRQSYSTGKVSGNMAVGGLVGYSQHSLEHCHTACTVIGGTWVGGLVGTTYGTVAFCFSTGTVDGDSDIGGLVGLHRGWVSQSYSTGVVIGLNAVGGLIGYNGVSGARPFPGDIDRSYSLASVQGETRVGGLVGDNRCGSIRRCYSAGAVNGTDRVGGLVGSGQSDVTASFWDTKASGIDFGDFGEGKTTAEMQTAGTFLAAGWDFVGETENGTEDIWRIDEGKDYPRLWREREEIESPAIAELDAENFDAEIADGVILVDFYATWCPACIAQDPILDEVAERLGDQARVARLDADQARDIGERYGIWAIPTLIVFCDGLPWVQFVGTTDADTLVDAVLWAVESQG